MKVKSIWIIENAREFFEQCIFNIAKIFQTESGDYYAEYQIWGMPPSVSVCLHIEKISEEKALEILPKH